MQVNYVYELATIDANHSAYVTSGAVAASPAVRALVDLQCQSECASSVLSAVPLS